MNDTVFYNLLRNISLIFFCWLLIPACKTPAGGITKATKAKSNRFLLKQLKQQQQDFEWFRGKAKITFETSEEKRNVSSTIYVRKDSLIWLNIKKVGVEAFRIQITPDSIYIINRLDKNYAIKPLSFIEKKFNLTANFKSLQALFLGNPIFLTNPKELVAGIKEDQYHLAGKRDQLTNEYFMAAGSYLLAKMSFVDLATERTVEIEQGDYQDGEEYQNFSYFRSININSTHDDYARIDLKFKKITINTPKTIRFEIPSHYTKID